MSSVSEFDKCALKDFNQQIFYAIQNENSDVKTIALIGIYQAWLCLPKDQLSKEASTKLNSLCHTVICVCHSVRIKLLTVGIIYNINTQTIVPCNQLFVITNFVKIKSSLAQGHNYRRPNNNRTDYNSPIIVAP